MAYSFHDDKKSGADPVLPAAWYDAQGRDTVLNRADTTFKKLPATDKAGLVVKTSG